MDTGNQSSSPDWSGASVPGSSRQLGHAVGARRSTLVLGASGTGKTVFALQALVSAAREGEPGVFVGIGESVDALLALGRDFGWDLPKLQAQSLLAIHTYPAHTNLCSMLDDVVPFVAKLQAKRLALDSLQLAALPPGTGEQMREMLLVRDSLYEQGLTTVFTCGTDFCLAATQCAALLQCLVDCAVRIGSRPEPGGAKRFLRVLKYRAAPFMDWEFPFSIGPDGIELEVPAGGPTPGAFGPELGTELDLARKRLATGLQALDRFLEMKQAELDFLLEKAAEQGQLPGMKIPISPHDPYRIGPQEIL